MCVSFSINVSTFSNQRRCYCYRKEISVFSRWRLNTRKGCHDLFNGRHGLLWYGTRFPCPCQQGTQSSTAVQASVHGRTTNSNSGPGNSKCHARIYSEWASTTKDISDQYVYDLETDTTCAHLTVVSVLLVSLYWSLATTMLPDHHCIRSIQLAPILHGKQVLSVKTW